MLTIRIWENCLSSRLDVACLAPVQRTGIVQILMEVFHGFKESECEEIVSFSTWKILKITNFNRKINFYIYIYFLVLKVNFLFQFLICKILRDVPKCKRVP